MDHATVGPDTTEGLDLLDLPRGARLLYVELVVWSCGHDTDGFIPRAALRRITDEPEPEQAIELLVAHGDRRVETTNGGWRLPRFADEQLLRMYKEKRRADSRTGQTMLREHRAGIHTHCNPQRCNEAVNVDSTPSQRPRTEPNRTVREGEGEGGDAVASRAADAAALAPRPVAEIKISPRDEELLRKMRDGKVCFACAEPLSSWEEERGHPHQIGAFAMLMHSDCPVDGRPGWELCEGIESHLVPEAMLVDGPEGGRFCHPEHPWGCGGAPAFAKWLVQQEKLREATA